MKNFSQISEALKYIDEHFDESITLEMLSKKFYLSPFYFHKLFSVIVGKSLAAYIRDRRAFSRKSIAELHGRAAEKLRFVADNGV